MNVLMKFLFSLSFITILVFSCANSNNMSLISDQSRKIEFTEIRRLNNPLPLKEASVIHSTQEIKKLYDRLRDSKYSRSAPIPVLEGDKESFLVIKPQLNIIKYGDIEIQHLELSGSTLKVSYREIQNPDYEAEKQSDPILIIKIPVTPQKIKLNRIKL